MTEIIKIDNSNELTDISYSDTHELFVKDINKIIALSNMLSTNDLVPKAYKNNPQQVFKAITLGNKLGLDVFNSLQSLYDVNGTMTIWGSAVPALASKSGLIEDEWFTWDYSWDEYDFKTQEVKTVKGIRCTYFVKRKDRAHTMEWSFSTLDAAKINKGTSDVYSKHLKNMLLARARTNCYRAAVPEIFCGLYTDEEIKPISSYKETKEEDINQTMEDMKNVAPLDD